MAAINMACEKYSRAEQIDAMLHDDATRTPASREIRRLWLPDENAAIEALAKCTDGDRRHRGRVAAGVDGNLGDFSAAKRL
jgi:hypothetical protein